LLLLLLLMFFLMLLLSLLLLLLLLLLVRFVEFLPKREARKAGMCVFLALKDRADG
jgi:hypothetical protein